MALHTANSAYLIADWGKKKAIAALSSGQCTFLLHLLLKARLLRGHRDYGRSPGSGQSILPALPMLLSPPRPLPSQGLLHPSSRTGCPPPSLQLLHTLYPPRFFFFDAAAVHCRHLQIQQVRTAVNVISLQLVLVGFIDLTNPLRPSWRLPPNTCVFDNPIPFETRLSEGKCWLHIAFLRFLMHGCRFFLEWNKAGLLVCLGEKRAHKCCSCTNKGTCQTFTKSSIIKSRCYDKLPNLPYKH